MFTQKQNEKILAQFRTAVQASHGAKNVAESIGKKYPTFMRELSPFDSNAKLGFMDAIAIIKIVDEENRGQLMKAVEKELGVKIELS